MHGPTISLFNSLAPVHGISEARDRVATLTTAALRSGTAMPLSALSLGLGGAGMAFTIEAFGDQATDNLIDVLVELGARLRPLAIARRCARNR